MRTHRQAGESQLQQRASNNKNAYVENWFPADNGFNVAMSKNVEAATGIIWNAQALMLQKGKI